ncbi:4,5:9,10-diseco-3-hydroxy-5,9, 17-trioxoandrosta-1(10),2-diene-4-oate hydrolase [Arthrobacter saudimassiliensis]|uniref:4,5:9,10-diseco-3-hydroxy-5,9, 17-trioxoandrosta-1(10),2-diene-4-oate hydrolase n=1 Tax=Arthrobacter saudimassiliensis TaxID=1461584 RepID=A0A078MTX4_9MICC|nr:4,5:9,10-diseco-3-hydroxy-5,9, 17-trioxoandrosta-1(10),2-diene-4-oate hydrolase [Arthrobacter saudimassiliensis]
MSVADARWIQVEGTPLRVRVSGPASGPPVLLLHGVGRSLEDWQDAHDLLAADHRVISSDHPGFGLSPKGTVRPSLAWYAAAAATVLDAVGEDRPVHVMGNSLGGAVAMQFAARYPRRVASLVLVNSAGFGRVAKLSLAPVVLGLATRLPRVGPRFRQRAREAGAQANRRLFFDPAHATEARLRHAAQVGRQPDHLATFATVTLGLGLPYAGVYRRWRTELLEAVAGLGLPTLVVWGDADRILPNSQLDAALAALPNAQSHVFADTGHMPQIERAAEFADLARRFIRQSGQDGAGRGPAAEPGSGGTGAG